MDAIQELEQRIGYVFGNKALLKEALTHPSISAEVDPDARNNQRLEFLGDAILGAILAEALFKEYEDSPEGSLTQAKSLLAKGESLFELGKGLELTKYLAVSPGGERSGVRKRLRTYEDGLEALIGAVFLDSDYATTRRFILELFKEQLADLPKRLSSANPKGTLQEYAQAHHLDLHYLTTDESGPDHAKSFTVTLFINGEAKTAGTASSKHKAQEQAAAAYLKSLKL